MNKLIQYLAEFYSPADYPALNAQFIRWRSRRPFAGKKILDATPVFRNTLVKYLPLLAGGADLTIAVGKDIPCDPEIVKIVADFGIKVADKSIFQDKFDAVADCAGRHCQVNSISGYAELTRSGLEYYKECKQPCFSVDSGILKRFETTLGTGESFIRAMKHLGFTDVKNRCVIVFGGGKVGKGVAYFTNLAGAETYIIDPVPTSMPDGVIWIDPADKTLVSGLISRAWCIISATGMPDALAEYAPLFQASAALLANMGVEDEFSSAIPAERVLNGKRPLNFILEEPTRINCIDPSMALSNAALLLLLENRLDTGINLPPRDLEMSIIDDIRAGGRMDKEIDFILKGNI